MRLVRAIALSCGLNSLTLLRVQWHLIAKTVGRFLVVMQDENVRRSRKNQQWSGR
jgi:hypothetical protein